MEVTTVSPSPTSPTEGDDLCEIDVTSVAIHIVTLLICLCGLAGNGAVLCLLQLEDVVYGIFSLAVTDFLFLLFTVPSVLLFLVEDMSCSTVTPHLYVSFLFQLSVVSFYRALYLLTPRKTVVHMLKLCCPCNFPERLRWILGQVEDWAFFALFTVIPTVTFLCQSQEQEHCRAALISSYAIILLLFVAPVLIYSTMDIIKAMRGSPEQQTNRRNIVIFIILHFTVLLTICNFLWQLDYIIVPTQVFFLLTCITSSIKPFIYFLAGRCWWACSVESLRNSLQRVFEEQKVYIVRRTDVTTDTVL